MRNWQIHFPFSRTNDSSSDIVSYFSFTPQSLKSFFFRLTLTTATPAIGIIATNLEQNVFLFLFSALCSQILSKVAIFSIFICTVKLGNKELFGRLKIVPYPYEVNGKLVTGNGFLISICSLSNRSLLPSLIVIQKNDFLSASGLSCMNEHELNFGK